MDQKPQNGKQRHWSWKQFGIALSLIPIGLLISYLLLGYLLLGAAWAMGWEVTLDYIVVYVVAFYAGLCIAVGGIIWTIALLIRFFVLRRRYRRS